MISKSIDKTNIFYKQASMKIVDGKLAGTSPVSEFAVRRLAIKLRTEKLPCHRWFLSKYKKFAKDAHDNVSAYWSFVDAAKIVAP